MQWYCQLLQSVAKSRAEFYFVQCFEQQKICETTHVTLCKYPATCLTTALRDRLLRKLHSVTGPYLKLATADASLMSNLFSFIFVTALAKIFGLQAFTPRQINVHLRLLLFFAD